MLCSDKTLAGTTWKNPTILLVELLSEYLRYYLLNDIFEKNLMFRIHHLLGWFLNNSLLRDLNKLQEGIGEKVGMLVFSVVSFIVQIVNAFVHGWELTLVMLAVQPVINLPIIKSNRLDIWSACVTWFQVVIIALGLLGKVQASATEKELGAYAKAGGVAEEVLSAVRTDFAFFGDLKEVERFSHNLVFAKRAGIKRGLATAAGLGVFK